MLPSSKRHPCPNHKRQPFFQSLRTEPLFSHTSPATTTTKKYICSRFSVFYPETSPPSSFSSSSNPLCLRGPSLLRSTSKGEKKIERKKKKIGVAAGVGLSRTADVFLEGKVTESGKRKTRGEGGGGPRRFENTAQPVGAPAGAAARRAPGRPGDVQHRPGRQ